MIPVELMISFIVSIASACTSIAVIYKFVIAQPKDLLRRKKIEKKQEFLLEMKEFLEQEMSLANIGETLAEIKEMNSFQNIKIELLYNTQVDVIRQDIIKIYYAYKDKKQLPLLIKENLEELYLNYKSLGGNYFVDKLIERMRKWEILDDNEQELFD